MSVPDLLRPLQHAGALEYLPDPSGLLSAREAVSDYYAGHGAVVSPEQIVLTASTSEAYGFIFRLLCNPGEEVLVAQPSYPLFDYLADLHDVKLGSYPLFYDHGWWIDTAELERAVTPATRAIIVVHPNNPTGHLTGGSEREYLYELCRRGNLALIVDEVFLDYPHEHTVTARTFAVAESTQPLTFVLSGLSKIAALPQVKVGWILALGPEAERLEASARLEIIADTFLSVSTPSQLALPAWLREAPNVQQQVLGRISLNLNLLAEAGLESYETSAGWSLLIRLPRVFDDASAFETLRRQYILAHPAYFYGLLDSKCVVISLITPTHIVQQALERMADLL